MNRSQPRTARKSLLFGRKSSKPSQPNLPSLPPSVVSSTFQDDMPHSPFQTPPVAKAITATFADDNKNGPLSPFQPTTLRDVGNSGVKSGIFAANGDGVDIRSNDIVHINTTAPTTTIAVTPITLANDNEGNEASHPQTSPVTCAAAINRKSQPVWDHVDPAITTATVMDVLAPQHDDVGNSKTAGSSNGRSRERAEIQTRPRRRRTLGDRLRARMSAPSGRHSSAKPMVRRSLREACVSAARKVSSSPASNNVGVDYATRIYQPDAIQLSQNVRPLSAATTAANDSDKPDLEEEEMNEVYESMTRDISSPFYFLRSVDNNRDASSSKSTYRAHPGANLATSTRASSAMMEVGRTEPVTTSETAAADATRGEIPRSNRSSRATGRGGFSNGWIHGAVNSIRKLTNGNATWKAGVYDFKCDGQTALQELRGLLEREYFGVIVSVCFSEVRMRVPLTVNARLSLINIKLCVEHRGDSQSRISIRRSFGDTLVVRYEDFDWFCFDVFRRMLKVRNVVRPYYC